MTTSSTVPLPATIEAVDQHWLTAALRESGVIGSADSVDSVEAQRIALDTGFSSDLYRVGLTGDDAVPASVVIKLPTGTAVRDAMDLLGGYSREVAFYERIAGRLDVRLLGLGPPRMRYGGPRMER